MVCEIIEFTLNKLKLKLHPEHYEQVLKEKSTLKKVLKNTFF